MSMVFQILVTTLLTIVIGLSTWTLKTVLRQESDVTQIKQQIWGRDGRNGHSSELKDLKSSFSRIEKYLTRLGFRMLRVEEKLGIDSGEHRRPDDPEGD